MSLPFVDEDAEVVIERCPVVWMVLEELDCRVL